MQSALEIVVVVVGVVGVLGAVASLLTNRRTWESLGSGRLLMESDLHDRRPGAGSGRPGPVGSADPAARLEREADIRQMLQAGNARRRRRGQPELDVDAELARLTAAPTARPGVDEELRDEVRTLVIARNHRRIRRGLTALDVEAEVRRELARLI